MTTLDVFISYAHVDNEALLEAQDGWVSILQRALQKRLGQLVGRPAVVWWDRKRLTGNCYFDETLATACEDAAAMVSVVTPRYLKSDYCHKEVEHFSKCKNLKVGDRSRLFTCVKTPVPRGDLLPQMGGKLGYEFFRMEAEGHRFREFDVYDLESKPLFMATLEDLAQDIGKLIESLEAGAAPTTRTSMVVSKTVAGAASLTNHVVFLATTTSDVKAIRDGLQRELSVQECVVRPNQPWSEDVRGFELELDRAADGVSLAVHLFGASYGTMPEDATGSYPVLQYELMTALARQRPSEDPLARIIWLPRGLQPTSEKQRAFVARVRSEATLGPLDELLEGSEEELKERIFAKLEALRMLHLRAEERERAATRSLRGGVQPADLTEVKMVYVISSNTEGAEVEEVERFLAKQGFDVVSSLELEEEETEAQREVRHQQLLADCDGCLIYHGATKLSWVRAQIDEVRKALGHRRQGPMQGRAVYVAPPLEGLKRRYQVQFPKLEGVTEPARDLLPFVQQLTERTTTPAITLDGAAV